MNQVYQKALTRKETQLRDRKFLSTTDVKIIFGVSYETVRKWAISGVLKSYKHPGKFGNYKFYEQDLVVLKSQRRIGDKKNDRENIENS